MVKKHKSVVAHIKTQRGETDMTRETMNSIKRNKQEAAEMVRFANPKSKTRPTMERVIEILVRHVPYMHREGKPEIVNVEVARYSANQLIKCADFTVTLANGKVWRIDVHQNLKGRTPEQREADKTADYPSGLFHFFHKEITETKKGDGFAVPTETEVKEENGTKKTYIVKIYRADGTTNRNDGQEARYNIQGQCPEDVTRVLIQQGYTENANYIEVYECVDKPKDGHAPALYIGKIVLYNEQEFGFSFKFHAFNEKGA